LSACKSALCYWRETILYSFTGNADGAYPEGNLIFSQTGDIYGATFAGGNTGCQFGTASDCGVVYSLTTGGLQSSLYLFPGGADGDYPAAGVIQDQAGNLYGTVSKGGSQGCFNGGCGLVYELSPNGSGWTEKVLYTFQGGSDGTTPLGGLISDAAGNLYGTTASGGSGDGGTVFELTPSGGQWNFHLLYSFNAPADPPLYPGPHASLVMDSAGSLYGTASADGANGYGSVFKLTPSGGGWTFSSLYDFTGGVDGAAPLSSLIFDSHGNLYGTASAKGMFEGVAFEITP
jgi:uncharacterized repeat protein (TIGR03803 family)